MRTAFPDQTAKVSVDQEKLMTLASTSVIRQAIATGLGKSYGGDRDVYAALGYKTTLSYTDFILKYQRQDIAKRIITAYPDATWRGNPDVYENEDADTETAFELAWKDLVREIDVWHYFTRADKLCGIGRYSVLFLGFNDGADADQPVTPSANNKLIYLQPYSEDNATVASWDEDPKSSRYGLPEVYDLKLSTVSSVTSKIAGNPSQTLAPGGVLKAHWSRCLHIAEDLLENNMLGTPRLECVYNRLQNLELVVGGGAEMWWRSALPGIALEMEGNARIADEDALNEEIEEYVHNLRRVLKLQGMKANNLAPTIANPKAHVEVLLQMISGATGIPVRILTGSERGELSSTQDRENWSDRVQERRNDFAEPTFIRAFVKALQAAGALPPLQTGTTEILVEWPDADTQTEKERAEILDLRMKAIKAYVESGADMLIPPMMFLTVFLGMTKEEADEALKEVEVMLEEEKAEAEEAEAAIAADREAELAAIAKGAAVVPPAIPTPKAAAPLPPAAGKKPAVKKVVKP